MVGDLVDDEVDQRPLGDAARAARRHLDDPPQLVVRRRTDDDLGIVEQLGQRADRGQGGVLVGAHHDHDVDVECGVEDEVDQPSRQSFTRLVGDRLLELVDDEQLGPRLIELGDAVEGGRGVVAGDDHGGPPRSGAREAATAHERDEAGAHQRRLATP